MTVITIGTFDLFHYGHMRLLRRCRDLAGEDGFVRVGLNTDEFIEKYKKSLPVMTYSERSESIYESGLVDQVLPNTQDDGSVKPIMADVDLIVIGSDWGRKPYLEQIGLSWEWLDSKEVSLCYVPYTWEMSTTEIKKRIHERSDSLRLHQHGTE